MCSTNGIHQQTQPPMLQLLPRVPSHTLRSGRGVAPERAAGEHCGRQGRLAHTHLSTFFMRSLRAPHGHAPRALKGGSLAQLKAHQLSQGMAQRS